MPGLGQLYIGRPGRALLVSAGLITLQIMLCLIVFFTDPKAKLGVALYGLVGLAFAYLSGMLDAFIQARRIESFETARFDRRRWGLVYFIVAALIAATLLHVERLHLLDLYRVRSVSMSPGLLNGDYVIVNRQAHCIDCAQALRRGDIVVFEEKESALIKRLVGLPGDRIEIDKQTLRVNGQPATGLRADSLGSAALDHFHRSSTGFSERLGPYSYLSLWGNSENRPPISLDVPAGHIFVLGDNRHHSKDSRQLGAVPLERVRGRADQIWFSSDHKKGARFERLGQPLALGAGNGSLANAPTTSPEPRPSSHPASPPNLLLITIDTLRADHVGVYGHTGAKTETLDGIAGLGVRFENALTPFPRTTPALASLFTGLSPQNHGSRDVGVPIKHGKTLAEVLREQGYSTQAVSGTALAGEKQGFARGFDRFAGRSEDMAPMSATEVTKQALELVAEASPHEPKFLWVHYFDPHFPYLPPPGFGDQPRATECRRLIQKVLANPRIQWSLHSNWGGIAQHTLSDCLDLYDAEIHYTDTEIAQLLYGLGQLDFLKSVIIVVTADHGESFGESGTYYEHGATVHDAVVRIPLMIAGPGIEPAVDASLFSLEDLMPTLLGLLSVPSETQPSMDGHDFTGRLLRPQADPPLLSRLIFAEGANTNKPPLFALPFDAAAIREDCRVGGVLESCARFAGAGELLAAIMAVTPQTSELPAKPSLSKASDSINARFRAGEARQRSVRTAKHKLVQAPRVDGGVQRSFFELEHDPLEMADTDGRHPQVRARLEAELDAWLSQLPKPQPSDLDPSEIDALRQLGYLE